MRCSLGIMAIFLEDTHIIMGAEIFLPMAAWAMGPLSLQPTACLAGTALMTCIPVFHMKPTLFQEPVCGHCYGH